VSLLDLLPQLYGQVIVPRQVVTEYQVKARPSDPNLERLPWLAIHENLVIDPNLPLLDSGEAAALTLAQMIGARFVLIDEVKARRVATYLDSRWLARLEKCCAQSS
jgi:predicted nucleic acid-binding protein